MLFSILAFAAVVLTFAMFQSRNSMLGFPCGIFWAILGGYSYTLSTATWDIYYFLFIASAMGMTIFSMLAAYGLRERRDTPAEKEMEKGEGKHIDEGGDGHKTKTKNWYEDDGIPDHDVEAPSPIKRRENRLRREKRRETLR